MPTLTEYFRTEARDLLATLEQTVASGRPDTAELHRTARGLRGTAQIAREERFFRAVLAFENVTRSAAAGVLAWSEDMTERARSTVADLRALLEPHADVSELEARAAAVAARWQRGSPTAATPPATAQSDAAGFREFAGREAAAIAETINQGIRALQADPMDREPLRTILRRQRALLGAARLEEIPVVEEILRAIEDLTRVIAKLDVGVKQEWLDIYRVARDGLQGAIATLLRGGNPEPSHALSRLRHMRAELLERYGEGEAVSTAHETPGLVQATPMDTASADAIPAVPAAEDEVLELNDAIGDAAGDYDAVLELDEAVVEEEPVLELSESGIVEEEPVLELSEAGVVEEEPVLELSEAGVVEEEPVLELSEAGIVEEETVLELSEAGVIEEEPVLELSEAGIVEEEPVLDLTGADTIEDAQELQVEPGRSADTRAIEPSPLERALELREIVARASAHDARARAALDELLMILRKALE